MSTATLLLLLLSTSLRRTRGADRHRRSASTCRPGVWTRVAGWLFSLFSSHQDRCAAAGTFSPFGGPCRRPDGAGPLPPVGADVLQDSLGIRAGLRAILILPILIHAIIAAPPAAAQVMPEPATTGPVAAARTDPASPARARIGVATRTRVCVVVDIAGHKAGELECATQALQEAARTAQAQARAGLDPSVTHARSPDIRTGVASQSATRQRLGRAFGISVHPQRPVPGPSRGRPTP